MFLFLGVEARLNLMLTDIRCYDLMKLQGPTEKPPDCTSTNMYESTGWWDHVVQGYGRFVKEAHRDASFFTENDGHNIVLTMCVDAFVPFKGVKAHSITPFMFMVLNLPENLRHRHTHMILAAEVPGPKKPQNLQTYIEVVVKELLRLSVHGVKYINPRTKEPCVARIKLLLTNADYPGHSDLNHQQCMGGNACMKCIVQVSSNAFDICTFRHRLLIHNAHMYEFAIDFNIECL